MKSKILVVDDELDFLESVRRGLITSGFKDVHTHSDPLSVANLISNGSVFDVALIDITMPGMDGIELLQLIKNTLPRTECIMITALDEARLAVECLKRGAYDYLVKPVSKEELILSTKHAIERKRLLDILDIDKKLALPKLNNPQAFSPIITHNERMIRILKIAELHAADDAPILITGETGTGKELLAHAVHAASLRSNQRFTPINMDALTGSLFDAEFFGHTKGAFTGAERDRAGYLETTHRGTLFLDEIGNLPPELQGKLLRVLQDGEFIKIGTSKPRKVDVRIIAATNKDLDEMMAKDLFRKDLYYRLSGGWLQLPPLRDRIDDLPLLVNSFLKEFGAAGGGSIEESVVDLLMAYDYPGNIRELKSLVKSAVNLSQGEPINLGCLPPHVQRKIAGLNKNSQIPRTAVPTLASVEKAHILKVYRMENNNKALSARILGIGISTLRRKLQQYNIK